MIPPSVDELMWLLAEQGEAGAVESFCKRYPDLRPELLRRMRMVGEMKGLKNEIPVPAVAPAFRPGTPVTVAPRRWWVVPSFAFGLALVGFGAFFATRQAAPTRVPVATPETVSVAAPAPKQPQYGTVHSSEPTPKAPPDVHSPVNLGNGDVPPINKPNYSDRLFAVVDINVKDLPSQVVISQVLSQVGLKPVFGPGMTNDLCTLDVAGLPAKDALTELGDKVGFSFFDQQDGTVLILPQVDSRPKSEIGNGSAGP